MVARGTIKTGTLGRSSILGLLETSSSISLLKIEHAQEYKKLSLSFSPDKDSRSLTSCKQFIDLKLLTYFVRHVFINIANQGQNSCRRLVPACCIEAHSTQLS